MKKSVYSLKENFQNYKRKKIVGISRVHPNLRHIYIFMMDIKGLMGGLMNASRALFANYMNIYNALIYMARKG